MHKGRLFPYHPTYWATNAWFWPGYVPWKIAIVISSGQPSPWDIVPAATYITEPGITSSPIPNGIIYRTSSGGASWQLELGLDSVGEWPGWQGRWSLSLSRPVGSPALVRKISPAPLYSVTNSDWPIRYLVDPYSTPSAPNARVRAATWAETGQLPPTT